MLLSDLDFDYPEDLIATRPVARSRVMLASQSLNKRPREVSWQECLDLFAPGDLLVINETKVIPKKISVKTKKAKTIDVLFIDQIDDLTWTVLLPLSRLQKGEILELPEALTLEVIEGGIPQKVRLNRPVAVEYFFTHGKMPLPPYIEKARKNEKKLVAAAADKDWYQTDWAKHSGSAAAPTASFHFKTEDFEYLQKKGVGVEKICLHVGLGTFLPIQSDSILEHKMHSESAIVSQTTWQKVEEAKKNQKRVWALGTTVCRSLESIPLGKLQKTDGVYKGETDIFIYPGFEYKVVDALLTNFHQPKTTLLALVAAFSSLDLVKYNYRWAIENQFRLFSYGDLSIWLK